MADGNYYTILSNVAAELGNATFAPPVVTRWKLEMVEGDTVPLLIVATGSSGESYEKGRGGGGLTFGSSSSGGKPNVMWAYPIVVAYVVSSNQTLTAGLQAFMNTREQIRNLLFQVFLGNTKNYDIDFDPDEVVKFATSIGTNYAATGWAIRYKNAETYTIGSH